MILVKPYASQPALPALNLGHPLLYKADFVMLGSQYKWNPLRRTVTYTGTHSFRFGPTYGAAPIFSNAAHMAYPEPTASGGTSPWTIAGIFVPNSLSSNSGAIAGTCEAPGNATQDRCLMFSSTGKWEGYLHDGAVKRATSTASPVVGRADTIVVTTNGSEIVCAVSGVPEVSVAVGTVGFVGYTSAEFVVGYANGTVLDGIGIPLFIRSQRYWTLAERASFMRNPWQIFTMQRRLPINGVAGAAPSSFMKLAGSRFSLAGHSGLAA